MRGKDSHFWLFIGEVDFPTHVVFGKDLRFKLSRQVLARNGEVGKFPLNPKKEGIVGAFDVFVELDDVSVVAGEEFGDGVDEANLIRAADQ